MGPSDMLNIVTTYSSKVNSRKDSQQASSTSHHRKKVVGGAHRCRHMLGEEMDHVRMYKSGDLGSK